MIVENKLKFINIYIQFVNLQGGRRWLRIVVILNTFILIYYKETSFMYFKFYLNICDEQT